MALSHTRNTGTAMKPKKRAAPPDPNSTLGVPYAQMTQKQKVRFVVKLVVCIITFGFAFPNIMD